MPVRLVFYFRELLELGLLETMKLSVLFYAVYLIVCYIRIL